MDRLIHPWVDRKAALLLEKARKGDLDLWHMRVEWGVDCRLLERRDLDFLWNPPLRFPSDRRILRPSSDSGAGSGKAPVPLIRNKASMVRWVRWLPWILLWAGKIRPGHRKAVPGLSAFVDRTTRKLLGEWLAGAARCRLPAVLAAPCFPSDREMEEVLGLGRKGVKDFLSGAAVRRSVEEEWKEKGAGNDG